jgi:hypothetical protein
VKLFLQCGVALIATAVCATAVASWPECEYKSVRAFAYNRKGDLFRPIIKNGRFDSSVVNPIGAVLNDEQVKRLIAAVTGKHPEHKWIAACFYPRHAFVFFDAAGHPVAWVEVCFECNNAKTEPPQKDQLYDMAALEKLRAELKLPTLIDEREREERIKKTEASHAHWLAVIPSSARAIWTDEMFQEPTIDSQVFKAPLAKQFPDTRERILALLKWFGSGEGQWSGFPSYESVPEELLLEYPTADLIAAVQSTTLDEQQIEGAARLFGGWEFSHQRPNDLKLFSAALKQKLLKHSLQSKDQDKRSRAKQAFAE